MEPIIDKLKKSPLFNLSLSSKELFHSNFLYWLAKNYHEEFGNEFKEYLKLDADDKDIKIKEKSIAREEKKLTYLSNIPMGSRLLSKIK